MAILPLASRFAAWKAYRETVHALSRLENRELDDLGISRFDIRKIAAKAVS